jgi:SET domain-containing protein
MRAAINPDYTWYRLALFRSKIHGRGVKAVENIPARMPVIEHTGLLINRRRYRKLVLNDKSKHQHQYLWNINPYWSMDGAVGGSGAEFVNHSCDPNLVAHIIGKRIYYYSRRAIKKGEELTIDYRFDASETPVPCRCGSEKCRGTINMKG